MEIVLLNQSSMNIWAICHPHISGAPFNITGLDSKSNFLITQLLSTSSPP